MEALLIKPCWIKLRNILVCAPVHVRVAVIPFLYFQLTSSDLPGWEVVQYFGSEGAGAQTQSLNFLPGPGPPAPAAQQYSGLDSDKCSHRKEK